MILERIYISAKHTTKRAIDLMLIKAFEDSPMGVYESKNGILIICKLEINTKQQENLYREIKKKVKAHVVYAIHSINEPFIEPVKPKPIVEPKPRHVFEKPGTIWVIDKIPHKRCSKCKQWEPVIEFSKDAKTTTGLQSQCKRCNRQYKIGHHLKVKENNKRFRENNPDYDKEYRKTYIYNPDKELNDHLKQN